jgi:hypothetical protein
MSSVNPAVLRGMLCGPATAVNNGQIQASAYVFENITRIYLPLILR